jgi:hypothetical protein
VYNQQDECAPMFLFLFSRSPTVTSDAVCLTGNFEGQRRPTRAGRQEFVLQQQQPKDQGPRRKMWAASFFCFFLFSCLVSRREIPTPPNVRALRRLRQDLYRPSKAHPIQPLHWQQRRSTRLEGKVKTRLVRRPGTSLPKAIPLCGPTPKSGCFHSEHLREARLFF